METTTKTKSVLKQALTTMKTIVELGKNMMKLKLKMTKCKAEKTLFNVKTKQTTNEAEVTTKHAKKDYELVVEKVWEAAKATCGTLLEETYDVATIGKVYRTFNEAHIEQAKAKYAKAKGATSKITVKINEKLKNLKGKHEEL